LENHLCHMFRHSNLREFQDYPSPLVVQICQDQAFWIHGIKFQTS
jgi:hypothetical protein